MIYILFLFLSAPARADNLDKACKAAASAYSLDYRLLKAISIVESSGGTRAALRRNRNGTYDAGPFQINSVHWSSTCKAYDVTKAHGGAMCAAKILASHKKHAKADPDWYGLYHSKTPRLKALYAARVRDTIKRTIGGSYVAVQY